MRKFDNKTQKNNQSKTRNQNNFKITERKNNQNYLS